MLIDFSFCVPGFVLRVMTRFRQMDSVLSLSTPLLSGILFQKLVDRFSNQPSGGSAVSIGNLDQRFHLLGVKTDTC
jgi:hypothetical protein